MTAPSTSRHRSQTLRAVWVLLSMSVRVSPFESVLCLAEPVSQLLQVLQPLYLAWFVAGAIHQRPRELVLAAAAYTVSAGLGWALGLVGTHARLRQMERVGFSFDRQIASLTAEIPTLEHLEAATYLDHLQTLQDQQGALGAAWMLLIISVNNILFVVGTLALAAGADWRLLLVALASLPMIFASRWTIRWQAAAEQRAAPLGRLSNKLLDLGVKAAPGAELRVFGLADPLRQRVRSAVFEWRSPMVAFSKRSGAVAAAGNSIFFLAATAVLGWMTAGELAGRVPLVVLTLALLLVSRLQNTSQRLQFSIQSGGNVIRNAKRYLWLVDYHADARQKAGGRKQPLPPARLQRGIRCEGLTYRYPNASTAALEDVTLDLPAGCVAALVGENGAGKTTLVKLLGGMYTPTAGTILVDGVDLAELDLTAWRQQLSGAFQDYARLELRLQQAIGVGLITEVDEPGRAERALTDAGSRDLLGAVPGGLTTQLGASWPGGVDLSGGQWQRVALARAMMRAAPLLLVLDEPTSALDASAEDQLFRRYAAAAREGRQRGAITLFVTHRFSTVRAADLVIVLQNGRICEVGSHATLMARKGTYAELYGMQAAGYS